jgi:hypothetical protein
MLQPREIVIVTTFKEFDGGRDSQIQMSWLQHLNNQTYKNFRLVVTSFREKHVKKALEASGVKYVFYQSDSDCLYSLTEMFANARNHIKPKSQIIVFPSPDHFFDDNFFEKIIEYFDENSGGTSFPHPQYLSVNDYYDNNKYDEYLDKPVESLYEYDPNRHIPETFYFDADLMLDERWVKSFFAKSIKGTFPGIAFHLLFLSSLKTLKNLVFETKVHKIISHVNPYTNKLDKINFLSQAHREPEIWAKNEEIVIDFCKRHKVNKKFYEGSIFRSRKLIMFNRFKPVGSLSEKLSYWRFVMAFSLFPDNQFVIKSKFKKLLKFYSE